MSDAVIKVENVSKDFLLPHEKTSTVKGAFTTLLKSRDKRVKEVQHALRDISFEVQKGEFFGIVGRNGSGKSTLLKVLANIYQPTKGSVTTHGKLIPFIELGVGFNPELTGRENVYLNGAMMGFSKKDTDDMYGEIVKFAELEEFMDQKLKNYSSGMQVRLAFSVATRAKADILLVDEVLAVGDADFQRKCFRYFKELKRNKQTAILVTHDMDSVREYCDRAMLINDQEVVVMGDPDTVAREYIKIMTPQETGSDNGRADRWGDGTVKISDPKVDTLSEQEVTFSYTVTAHKDCADPVYGFRIRGAEGEGLAGTNSRVLGNKPQPLEAGKKLTITWKLPNVFADGDYFIDPSVVYEGTNTAADWWDGAASFTVVRDRRTPYIVQPDVTLVMED